MINGARYEQRQIQKPNSTSGFAVVNEIRRISCNEVPEELRLINEIRKQAEGIVLLLATNISCNEAFV